MNKAMSSLCQELFREAQRYRVSIFKLAGLKRRMESGRADLSEIIPLLVREIEMKIRKNVVGEEERSRVLVFLNIKRNQFLDLRREAIYRRGK